MSLHLYKYNYENYLNKPIMKSKLDEFISRNRKRNAHLYENNLILGVDYLICPVSNERLSMIKSSYIEKVLQMSVEEYDKTYPNVRGVCKKRIENIKTGLLKLDESGLTKHQISTIKAKESLLKIDSTGVSGYKKKGQKTRQTHMNKVDECGRNGYKLQAHKRVTTLLPNGLTVEQNAHIKQKNTLISNNISGSGGASKISKKVLAPLIDYLISTKVKFYFDDTEYGIKDESSNNYYFYDLTILEYGITIEYQSNAWHSNPSWDNERWDSWNVPKGKKKTATESLNYDYNKARALYKHRNLITYYVWEDTATRDVEEILCLLKTMNMKF